MSFSNFLAWSTLLLATCPTFAASDNVIYIKSGQCVIVGTQQVCALKNDASTIDKPKTKTVKICRWGAVDEADPNVKGYGLYMVMIKEDGTKTETLINNFGPVGKSACEQARLHKH